MGFLKRSIKLGGRKEGRKEGKERKKEMLWTECLCSPKILMLKP